MKKPARGAVPAKGIVPAAAKAKAAQPGNAPGRGKAAHAKPGPAKAPPKRIPPKPKVSAQVKARRHAAAVKASKTRAANLKKAKQHPKRQLALSGAVACCSAEALAASLRLAGWPVDDDDVLALYLRTAADLDAGASILATLEAAAEYGLAGVRLRSFGPALEHGGQCQLGPLGGFLGEEGELGGEVHASQHNGLILGLSLPAPHAVLDTGSEWITWGQAWPAWAFPDAVIEEAWAVDWNGG